MREDDRRDTGYALPQGQGHGLKDLLTPPPAWMSAFGGLRSLHKETQRINRVLEEEFGRIEADEWR